MLIYGFPQKEDIGSYVFQIKATDNYFYNSISIIINIVNQLPVQIKKFTTFLFDFD